MNTNNNSNFKILVVDDDPDILRMTERLLSEKQYTVSTAINGQECNQAILRDKPDLLLLDVMLPDTSGKFICKALKSDPELSSIFVLLLSGMKTDSENISEGLESGADGYLVKPVKNRELLARVDAAIRIIQAERKIKQINTELRKANAEKDKFFSIIAHDVRGPLRTFVGLTQLMVEGLPDLSAEKIQSFSLKMLNSATNLSLLLENLLEWSMIRQGLLVFDRKELKLLPIVEESIAMVIETAQKKEIDITNEVPDDLVVYADQNLIQTVIRNLISNAVKYTRRGGGVRLSAHAIDGQGVEISIQDSGIGMSRTMIDQLFLLDVQTNRKGTEGEPSTGLGLQLSKEFIEKHGGKIRIESEEGKGSTFSITIPYSDKPEK